MGRTRDGKGKGVSRGARLCHNMVKSGPSEKFSVDKGWRGQKKAKAQVIL